MPLYRKKPVVIEATKYDGTPDGNQLIIDLLRDSKTPAFMDSVARPDGSEYRGLKIMTLEGNHVVTPGDWVIQGVAGEAYPCKPDIFAATYEAVEV